VNTGRKRWTFKVEESGKDKRNSHRVKVSKCTHLGLYNSEQSFPSVEGKAVCTPMVICSFRAKARKNSSHHIREKVQCNTTWMLFVMTLGP